MNLIAPKLTRQQDENSPGDYTVDEKHIRSCCRKPVMSARKRCWPKRECCRRTAASTIQVTSTLFTICMPRCGHTRSSIAISKYVVQNDEVIIVDEFTGRLMPGRRWSDGLHQAVEAKEGVAIQRENQTLASITFQNYFRMYAKLAGMTGTADTEAYEFQHIYALERL